MSHMTSARTCTGIYVLICVFSWIHTASCNGKFYVKFLEYKNKERFNFNGDCCDGVRDREDNCIETCDLLFQVSVYGLDGGNITNKRPSRRPINDTNSFSFTDEYRNDRNPVSFDFREWPGHVQIVVQVYDQDWGPRGNSTLELVDEMDYKLKLASPSPLYIFEAFEGIRSVRPSTMSLLFRYACDPTYYGSDCLTDCLMDPQNSLCPRTTFTSTLGTTLFPTVITECANATTEPTSTTTIQSQGTTKSTSTTEPFSSSSGSNLPTHSTESTAGVSPSESTNVSSSPNSGSTQAGFSISTISLEQTTATPEPDNTTESSTYSSTGTEGHTSSGTEGHMSSGTVGHTSQGTERHTSSGTEGHTLSGTEGHTPSGTEGQSSTASVSTSTFSSSKPSSNMVMPSGETFSSSLVTSPTPTVSISIASTNTPTTNTPSSSSTASSSQTSKTPTSTTTFKSLSEVVKSSTSTASVKPPVSSSSQSSSSPSKTLSTVTTHKSSLSSTFKGTLHPVSQDTRETTTDPIGKLTTRDPKDITLYETNDYTWAIILGCVLGGLVIIAITVFLVFNNRQKRLRNRREIYNVSPEVISVVEGDGITKHSDVPITTSPL